MKWFKVNEFGCEQAKRFADRHETDSYTSAWLYWRGMGFANNYYGWELGQRLLAFSGKQFRQRLYDEAERFVRADLACWIENWSTAIKKEGSGDLPSYHRRHRCGRA